MSEASAHKLSYIEEVTLGTTPTNPRFQSLLDTRTTLALVKDTLETERLTGDRFPAQPRMGARKVIGDIPAELSYGAYDDFIASAMQGDWVQASVGEDDVDITINAVPTAGIVATDTYATANGVVTFESVDSHNQVVEAVYEPTVPGAAINYTFNGLETIEIDGEDFEVTAYTDVQEDFTVKAGDTRKSFSILREFSDFEGGEKPFLLYKGCEVSSWSIEAANNSIAKSTFSFFGLDMEGPSTAAPSNTYYKNAIVTKQFDTFKGDIKIDTVVDCNVTEYSLTINNGHDAKFTVGCPTSGKASITESIVSGSITVYYANADLYEKFVDEIPMSLELTLTDLAGNKLIIDLPNLKIGSDTSPSVSADGSITMTLNFTAHKDDTLGSHVSVRRIADNS